MATSSPLSPAGAAFARSGLADERLPRVDHHSASSDRSPDRQGDRHGDVSPAEEIARLRRERDALQVELDRIAQIIKARPGKLEHDLRNVMNELVLLRKLAETED